MAHVGWWNPAIQTLFPPPPAATSVSPCRHADRDRLRVLALLRYRLTGLGQRLQVAADGVFGHRNRFFERFPLGDAACKSRHRDGVAALLLVGVQNDRVPPFRDERPR